MRQEYSVDEWRSIIQRLLDVTHLILQKKYKFIAEWNIIPNAVFIPYKMLPEKVKELEIAELSVVIGYNIDDIHVGLIS